MPGAEQIDFDRLKDTGCRTLSFAGRMHRGGFARDGTLFHLYIARIDPSRADLSTQRARVHRAGGGAAAVCPTTPGFALASRRAVEAIRRLF